MPDEDLPHRVSAVEEELRRMRGDVAAARILAAGADHDVSEVRTEVRAHSALFNALRADQVALREEMRHGFAQVDRNFAQVDRNFAQVEEQLTLVRAGLTQIVGLIEAITPE